MEDFLSYVFDLADNPFALFAILFAGAFFNTFFPPVPVEVGTVFAGYLVSQGHGSLWVIISSTTLGMFVGSVIFHRVAKIYGLSLLRKPFFARLINKNVLMRAEILLEKYGALAILLTKFIPGMYFCAIVASSILSIKKPKLYTAFFFVNLLVFSIHAYIGEMAGENWRHVYRALGKTGMFLLLLIAAAFVLTYFARKIFSKKP